MLENPNPKIYSTLDNKSRYDEIKMQRESDPNAMVEEGFDDIEG